MEQKPKRPNLAHQIERKFDLQCPICLQRYNAEKCPMFICQNQHCCCLQCLQKIFEKMKQEPESQFNKCTLCKAEIKKQNVQPHRLLKMLVNLQIEKQVANQNINRQLHLEKSIEIESTKRKMEQYYKLCKIGQQLTKQLLISYIPQLEKLKVDYFNFKDQLLKNIQGDIGVKQQLHYKINDLELKLFETSKQVERVSAQRKEQKALTRKYFNQMKEKLQLINLQKIQIQYVNVLKHSVEMINKIEEYDFQIRTNLCLSKAKLSSLPFKCIKFCKQYKIYKQSEYIPKYFNASKNYPIIVHEMNYYIKKEDFIKAIDRQKLGQQLTMLINKNTIKQAILKQINCTLNSFFQKMNFSLDFWAFQQYIRTRSMYSTGNSLTIILSEQKQNIQLQQKYFKKQDLCKIIQQKLIEEQLKQINKLQIKEQKINRILLCLLRLIKWKQIQQRINVQLVDQLTKKQYCIAASQHLNRDLMKTGIQVECQDWQKYISKSEKSQTITFRQIQQIKGYSNFYDINQQCSKLNYLKVDKIKKCKNIDFNQMDCVSFGKTKDYLSQINRTKLGLNDLYQLQINQRLTKSLQQEGSLKKLIQEVKNIVGKSKRRLTKTYLKQLQSKIMAQISIFNQNINGVGFELTSDLQARIHIFAINCLHQVRLLEKNFPQIRECIR